MLMSNFLPNRFLKVGDIKASGPIQVTITSISVGRFGKPNLAFNDGTQLSLNDTNNRVLIRAYGPEGDDWIGKQIELALGEVLYKEKPQEAILVRPLSPPTENKAPPVPEFDDDPPF